MENTQNTSLEGVKNNTDTTGTQNERTFTQDDVNRIVQERLAKEKSKGNEELDKRAAQLDARERRMNAADELRKNNLPEYLVDALNMNTDEDFQKSMEAIKKWKGETGTGETVQGTVTGAIIGKGDPIGVVKKGISNADLREAFGLG